MKILAKRRAQVDREEAPLELFELSCALESTARHQDNVVIWPHIGASDSRVTAVLQSRHADNGAGVTAVQNQQFFARVTEAKSVHDLRDGDGCCDWSLNL